MWLRIEFFMREKFRKIFAILGGVLLLSLVGCSEPSKTVKDPEEKPIEEIVPPTGAQLFRNKACYACHGTAGGTCPSLVNFVERELIANKVPNTTENLRKWLKDPSSIKYGTRMPNLNLSDWEIKLLIEYIYSL